jgi:hypothetical protein
MDSTLQSLSVFLGQHHARQPLQTALTAVYSSRKARFIKPVCGQNILLQAAVTYRNGHTAEECVSIIGGQPFDNANLRRVFSAAATKMKRTYQDKNSKQFPLASLLGFIFGQLAFVGNMQG